MTKYVDKTVDFIKTHIGIILTIFFDFYAIFNLKAYLSKGSNKIILLFSLFCIVVNIILILVLKKIKKLNNDFSKIFLNIALPIGLLYVVLIPVFAGTDEPFHFFRAYQISQGDIINSEDYNTKIPENLLNLHYRKIKENYLGLKGFKDLDKTSIVELPIKDTATSYSPIQYFPQIFGIKIGLIFNMNPMLIVMLSRLFVFVTWTIIIYHSIKIFPYNKLLFMLICLSPAMLSLVSTTSGDIMLDAFSFLLIAFTLKLFKDKTKLDYKKIILLLFLCVSISLCKTIYFIFTFLILIIPPECYGSKKKKWLYTLLILILSLFSDFLWVAMSSTQIVGDSSESSLQLKYILSHPLDYIFILVRTFLGNFYYYVVNLFSGGEMCYSKANIPSILEISYVFIVVLSMKFNNDTKHFKYTKYLFWVIFLMIFVATSTAMYINWTNMYWGVEYPTIEGVQSRYLIMTIPLLLIPYKINVPQINENKITTLCVYLNIYIMLFTISSLIIAHM